MTTQNHYNKHLASFYTWMTGGIDESIKKNSAFFTSHGISPVSSGTAIDLGAGSGIQSIPLSMAGFNVVAVDFCRSLLNEIDHTRYNIKIIEDDILNFEAYAGLKPELIVCMGDTLTHLPDLESVKKLVSNSYHELTADGKLILTFRDLTFALEGEKRFIPVKSDAERIFTCFLEHHGDYIDVYDIVHEKEEDSWIQKTGTYRKTVIPEKTIKEILSSCGFNISFCNNENGLITLMGLKN